MPKTNERFFIHYLKKGRRASSNLILRLHYRQNKSHQLQGSLLRHGVEEITKDITHLIKPSYYKVSRKINVLDNKLYFGCCLKLNRVVLMQVIVFYFNTIGSDNFLGCAVKSWASCGTQESMVAKWLVSRIFSMYLYKILIFSKHYFMANYFFRQTKNDIHEQIILLYLVAIKYFSNDYMISASNCKVYNNLVMVAVLRQVT